MAEKLLEAAVLKRAHCGRNSMKVALHSHGGLFASWKGESCRRSSVQAVLNVLGGLLVSWRDGESSGWKSYAATPFQDALGMAVLSFVREGQAEKKFFPCPVAEEEDVVLHFVERKLTRTK